MKNYFTYLIALPLALSLCSCGNLDYMSRGKFAEEAKGSILLQQPAFTNGEVVTPERQARIAQRTMGGLSFTPSGTKNGKPIDPVYFVLRRHKGEVSAETVLFNSSNKEKTFLDTSTIKFGVDRKNEGAGFDISFRW